MNIWIVLLILGILTFLIRFSFIAIFDKMEPPRSLQRALRFVPIAVLSAIISPEILFSNNQFMFTLINPKLIAALIASLVAYKTKNITWTIFSGMVSFWILRSILL
jgi:branched-subunit amino acid transport protein